MFLKQRARLKIIKLKGDIMQAVGIIVEYNPFITDTLIICSKRKQQTGADCVIAVMSGALCSAESLLLYRNGPAQEWL